MHYPVIFLIEVTKICFFNREILKTLFASAIDSPERNLSNVQPRLVTSEYCLIFNEPCEMFILQSFLYLFKGAKRMDFVLSSPKCPKWPKELREKNFHANSGIKILPNIINCWLLKSFGLMRCLLLLKNSLLTPPPTNISNPHF